MSYICEICFPKIEESNVFKAIFVLRLYAIQSFIFVNNAKLVHRRQPYHMIKYRMLQRRNLLTPWRRVFLEKLTSKLCS